MKFNILGCTNDNCMYWQDGQCDIPAFDMHPQAGVVTDTIMQFDYDFQSGKLICKMCEEE